jgi:hypothetical protein
MLLVEFAQYIPGLEVGGHLVDNCVRLEMGKSP